MSAVLAIMGGVTSAVGGIIGGQAQKKAGRAAARMHVSQGKMTSRRLEVQALDVLLMGNIAADRARHEGDTDTGRYRTAYASSGVDVSSGTAAHIQLRGTQIAAVEEMLLRDNASRQAMEFRVQGGEEEKLSHMKASYARASGNAAATASYFGAASSLLKGANDAGFFDSN